MFGLMRQLVMFLTKQWIKETGRSDHYRHDWWNGRDTHIEHFIEKDNIIFHCIIFPVMSMAVSKFILVMMFRQINI